MGFESNIATQASSKTTVCYNTLRKDKLEVIGDAGESIRRLIMIVLALVNTDEEANLRQKDLAYSMSCVQTYPFQMNLEDKDSVSETQSHQTLLTTLREISS